jgi:prolyl-tRNA synthetase
MFADWELIGVPYRVVVGERSLKEGFVEVQARTESVANQVPVNQVLHTLQSLVAM